VYHQDGRGQITQHLGGWANFDSLRRTDVAANLSRDDNRTGFDLRRDDSALADGDTLFGGYLAIDLPVYPSWAVE